MSVTATFAFLVLLFPKGICFCRPFSIAHHKSVILVSLNERSGVEEPVIAFAVALALPVPKTDAGAPSSPPGLRQGWD
jgi:hypothetical protein